MVKWLAGRTFDCANPTVVRIALANPIASMKAAADMIDTRFYGRRGKTLVRCASLKRARDGEFA